MDSALYIHIPFCIRKCSYCDFYSVKTDNEKVKTFLDMLKKEMLLYSEQSVVCDFQFRTLYIGGGTPSSLSASQLNDILETVRRCFRLKDDAEISMEINPETVSLEDLRQFKKTGINRLSIGIQSFEPRELKILKRIHSADTAVACVRNAQQAGFDNLSLDLMFAIPGQSLNTWTKNLNQAIAFSPQHISMYGLIIESGTLLQKQMSRGQYHGVGESVEREMYLRGIEILDRANIRHYEISNAAIPGFECAHNLMYWDGSPYLGLGPSAHSFWNDRRQWNVKDLNRYIAALDKDEIPVENFECLTTTQQRIEYILLGLRKTKGIDLLNFRRLFDIDFLQHYHHVIEDLTQHDQDLIRIEEDYLSLTPYGFVFYDEILINLSY